MLLVGAESAVLKVEVVANELNELNELMLAIDCRRSARGASSSEFSKESSE